MKYLRIGLLACVMFAIIKCDNNTKPEIPIFNTVSFHGQAYWFENMECCISGSVGGEIQYVLVVTFTDQENRRISFRIQDPNNEPNGFLTAGEHSATGHLDNIYNKLTGNSFSIGCLTQEQMAIFWEEIEVDDHLFNGTGYIHLKQRLDYVCADSIWIGGSFAYPGDPEYDQYYETYCSPGYYYPAQKVWFECINGYNPFAP